MFESFDGAHTQHWEQIECHVCRAKIFQHVAGKREGQPLTTVLFGRRNSIPSLLDIMGVGFLVTFGKANDTILQFGPFQVADPIERRELAGSELADPLDDRFHHIGFGGRKFFRLRKLFDACVNADCEQLVLGGWAIGHWDILLALRRFRYSARA